MATAEQRMKLRRKLQDLYDNDGDQLTNSTQAFQDDELDDLIEEGFGEATDGARTSSQASGDALSLAILLARADGLLMLAQDEAKRKKWELNNDVIDDTGHPKRLIEIATELRRRYESHRDRKQQLVLESKENRPTGGVLKFNDTVSTTASRNFNNRDTRRNTPRR